MSFRSSSYRTRSSRSMLRICVMVSFAQLVAFSGCAPAGPERRAVSGSVQLDGKPASGLNVVFIPRDGLGLGATAMVADGSFELSAEHGPSSGQHDVIFEKVEPELEAFERLRFAGKRPLSSVRIAPRFTRSGSLSVEVSAGRRNTFDFELSAK